MRHVVSVALCTIIGCAHGPASDPMVMQWAHGVPSHDQAVTSAPPTWQAGTPYRDTRSNSYTFSSYKDNELCVATEQFAHSADYLRQHPHHFQLWLLDKADSPRSAGRALYPSRVTIVDETVVSVDGKGCIAEVCFTGDQPVLKIAKWLYLTGGEDVAHERDEEPKLRVTEIAWRVGQSAAR